MIYLTTCLINKVRLRCELLRSRDTLNTLASQLCIGSNNGKINAPFKFGIWLKGLKNPRHCSQRCSLQWCALFEELEDLWILFCLLAIITIYFLPLNSSYICLWLCLCILFNKFIIFKVSTSINRHIHCAKCRMPVNYNGKNWS